MRRRTLAGLLGALLIASAAVAADEKPNVKTAYTDSDKAPKSFTIQGEYAGSWQEEGETRKVGIQVVAYGDDRFEAVAYPGGLPGEGWNGDEKVHGKGMLKDGVARFTSEKGDGHIENGHFIVEDGQGGARAKLPKVERKSKTLGMEPPAEAVVLFDGKSADKWVNGQTTDDDFLKVGTRTREQFGSHTLHLEFRTPYMPYATGQARGNSGVYIQGRYEIQVLDSFGLEGKNNECGGIYSLDAPKVNMCFPPLSWQTYDVDFTAAKYDDDGKKLADPRITVRHNGVVIHDDVELSAGTPGGTQQPGPGPGPLFLQNHGDPVVFRNIWIVPKK